MEKVIYDEKNGLWYELQGDYYIPYLKLPEEEQQLIGVWGQRHLTSGIFVPEILVFLHRYHSFQC